MKQQNIEKLFATSMIITIILACGIAEHYYHVECYNDCMRYDAKSTYKPRNPVLEQPEYGLWLDNYIRVYTSFETVEEYAKYIGETVDFVNSVIKGTQEPCERMLIDTKYLVKTKKIYIAEWYNDEE